MNTAITLKIGLSALALAGLAATGATHGFGLSAYAAAAPNAKKAASEAKAAQKALAKRDGDKAVAHAELAVANDPNNADYRALLGQSYLLAGRFASASQALSDALTLNPEDGRVALNLALAKVAQGDWAGARTMLQTHADQIPASDRGLAFALAGDPVAAVEILSPAARDAEATVKTRQNLALSLALAGRWKEASEIAAMDVAPDQLQARLNQWASFARPANAYDQVATLLGVTPVQDAGQPVTLALSQQPNVAVAAVTPAPAAVDAYMPGAEAAAPQPAALAEAAPVAAAPEAVTETASEPQQIAGTGPQVVFGPRSEVLQTIAAAPAPVAVAAKPVRPLAAAPARVAKASPVTFAKGSYFVQLGAYDNAAVARDAWSRHARRVPALAARAPQGANVTTKAGNFYRLSVGGFARNDAVSLCQQVKASGSSCFVRVQAGDAVAAWVKGGGAQVAAR